MGERSWLTGLGLCFCNVTFGVSIAGFSGILSWRWWVLYPSEPLAFIAFLAIVQLAPFVPLALFDLVMCRIAPPRVLRLWRLFLLALAIVGIAIAIGWQIVGHKSYYFLLALVSAPLAVPAYRAVREWSAVLATIAGIFTLLTLVQLGFVGSLARLFERPAIPDNSITLPGPVLILVYDELSADVLLKDGHIDASAFPNIAALAEDGVEFTDATTNNAFTFYSIPTMLSGRFVLPRWDRQTMHEHNVLSKLALHVPVRAYDDFFGDCMLANADCHYSFQGRPVRYALAQSMFGK